MVIALHWLVSGTLTVLAIMDAVSLVAAFEQHYWHDGATYLQVTGHQRHQDLVKALNGGADFSRGVTKEAVVAAQSHDPRQALEQLNCREEELWGTQVADKAISFLHDVGDEPFVLVVSIDEPHGPFLTPPEWQVGLRILQPLNYNAPLVGKPALQQTQAKEFVTGEWEDFLQWRLRHLRCNAWIDSQIGRVINAVDALHGDDTIIISTTDHGDMMGSHGLLSKGAMMYEECARIPFIARGPGIPAGSTCSTPVTLMDLLPTMLDYVDQAQPDMLRAQPAAATGESISRQPWSRGRTDSV